MLWIPRFVSFLLLIFCSCSLFSLPPSSSWDHKKKRKEEFELVLLHFFVQVRNAIIHSLLKEEMLCINNCFIEEFIFHTRGNRITTSLFLYLFHILRNLVCSSRHWTWLFAKSICFFSPFFWWHFVPMQIAYSLIKEQEGHARAPDDYISFVGLLADPSYCGISSDLLSFLLFCACKNNLCHCYLVWWPDLFLATSMIS